MKICRVIFSTNRIEYLTKTLFAQQNLNWQGCEVHSIFIDDYPKGRDDMFITNMVRFFGYKEIYLHQENKGLSVTWSEFWNLIRNRDYDYIWHQEDDIEILEPIKILDLIELLNQDSKASQVVLERQKWYPREEETRALDSDFIFKNYRYDRTSKLFSPMASLYSIDKVRFSYSDWYQTLFPNSKLSKTNLNEGFIGNALVSEFGLCSIHLKNSLGNNIINHIGEYFTGRRVLPNEPNYEQFSCYDPNKRYDSKTGEDWVDNK